MKKSKIIEMLEAKPCTREELPYKHSISQMSQSNRGRIQKIRVTGKSKSRCFRCGKFKTVYYLLGDEDLAAEKFVKVNAETLGHLNLSTRTTLDSGLNQDMAQRIKAILRNP
jgi:hypothetical protein